MSLAKAMFAAVAFVALAAMSQPAPVSREVKPAPEFVQKKTTNSHGKLTKAQYRKHLRTAMRADKQARAAIKSATRVRVPTGGHRDRSVHALRHAHADLQLLIKLIKHNAK